MKLLQTEVSHDLQAPYLRILGIPFFFLMLMDEVLETGDAFMSINDDPRKAAEVLINSELLDRGPVVTVEGILKGIYWQNVVLLASLFITAASLTL